MNSHTSCSLLMDQMLPKQREAFEGAIDNQIYLITGPGGTGKTYVIKQLVEYFLSQEMNIILAAPTGKAAKRMEQVSHHPAVTIHRLLGYNGSMFKRNKEDPINIDVLIIDEISMLDIVLGYHLFKAIDFTKTKLIFAGDHHQLPPVGPGNILRDILSTKIIPFTILDQVVRQAGALRKNSLEILNGKMVGLNKADPESTDWILITSFSEQNEILQYLVHLYENILYDQLGYDLLRDVQVLAPQKNGLLGIINLNKQIQQVVQKKVFNKTIDLVDDNKQIILYPGDKVIQTKNNYDLDIMNGHIGYVIENDPISRTHVIEFEDRGKVTLGNDQKKDILPAYSITTHRSQGSEYPCVINIIHSSHRFMLNRQLLYTSVTRAQKKNIIIGDKKGIRHGIKNQQLYKRRTFLSFPDGIIG